jgi:hypothetical protein
VPAFVTANAPPKAPPNTTPLAVVTVESAVNIPAPANVNTPFFTASPNATAPPKLYAFAKVRAVVESLDTNAPPNVTNPVPNAPSLPTYTAPAPNVVPPVNVFAPLSVSDPNPAFVSENAPPNTPLITTPLAVVTVVFAASVPEPLNVRTPFFTASPNVTAPPKLYAFANVRAVAPSLDTTAPASVTTPVPNAALFAT